MTSRDCHVVAATKTAFATLIAFAQQRIQITGA
jgi:hypothetical protein